MFKFPLFLWKFLTHKPLIHSSSASSPLKPKTVAHLSYPTSSLHKDILAIKDQSMYIYHEQQRKSHNDQKTVLL